MPLYFIYFVGHLAQDCVHAKGGKEYELIPEYEVISPKNETDTSSSRKQKKVNIDFIFLSIC